jgi:serine/threonine protein kinase
MELCNYFNLWHLILYKGHLKEIEAKIYIKNILAGLISMHHFGYSHRDIKSCNICIKNGHCVIIDLGCSKKNVNTE